MGSVRTPPIEEAKSVFDDLGYSVDGDGQSFRATRDWKEVKVTAIGESDPGSITTSEQEWGELRCFVAWRDHCNELISRLGGAVTGDWALIGVEEDGTYDVMHRSD